MPPAEVSFVAPIGDASLEYTQDATLYLPSHDGISLTAVTSQSSCSPVRPDAETLIRTLLSHAGTKTASSLGGSTRLSLYGTSPVEVSRDTVTVNLSASALQLDRESLYLTCQAITNTLTQLEGIHYVNILVVNKPVGLDIGNTLPMGALKQNNAPDLGAVYNQLLSRRADNAAGSAEPLSANVTLYFPLLHADGMVSETRNMTFDNQVFSDMVTSILRELAAGPTDSSIQSPPLPLLADLLTATPTLLVSEDLGGNIIALDFAHNLEEMLDAYGITHKQSMASLCYTLTTFFPNVNGIRVSINGTPVESIMLTEYADDNASGHFLLRPDFSELLYDYATLYYASNDQKSLVSSNRPVPYRQKNNPRMLLMELSKGPQPQDSQPDLLPVMHDNIISDTDMLGFSLSENTLLVNFSPSFADIGSDMTAEEERLMAYALVNTLCQNEQIKSVCFFLSGSQFDGFSGEIYWAGLFYPLPIAN
ncbi:MAG: GerMN domain-containing protein [Clostridia bacterium]|nr:GerMN domain-containing protein [Clostridia bacterium]